MHMDIAFPNIGITLEHVGKSISVFGFDIAYYGMVIGLGIMIGFWLAYAEAKRTGQNPEDYLDMGMAGVIVGIIGARIYYVVFSWDMYKDDPLSIFNLREGGLAIYGGIIGAVLTIFVCSKWKKISAMLIFDTVAMSILNGQMIGRWGNFFNREAFGQYTDTLLAMRLPMDAVRSGDVTELMLEHVEVIDGVKYIQVHPTFLYESLWCACLLLILFLYRKHKKFNGEISLLYLGGYALGRVWIEGLRTDQLILTGTQIPVSQLLAGVLVAVSVTLLIVMRIKSGKVKEDNLEKEKPIV